MGLHDCRNTTLEHVVTVDTAKHFIIPIETQFVPFLFVRQHKLWNDAQLRTATVTRFSWYFASNATVFLGYGLIKNIKHVICEILLKLKNF